MVKSPAQSGRIRTLIHPGPTSGGHVTIVKLLLPLPHLDRVDCVISGNLLDRLATTDLLYGDSSLNIRMCVLRLLIDGSPDQGRSTGSELTKGTVHKTSLA